MNPRGVNFLEQDWDTLIILDACRYDIFKNTVDLPGETDYAISLGSTSRETISANFRDKSLLDTVYVSANGWFHRLKDNINTEIFRFIYTDRDAADGLTSHPSTVTERALQAYDEHPNKRLIVHYMQPHQPYLGEKGKWIKYGAALPETVKDNNVSKGELYEAYKENLQLVADHVETLFEKTSGKMIVTADHGELLGEPQSPIPIRDYGHPAGIYVDELVKVPWHVYTSGSRNIVSANEPFSESEDREDNIDEHLKALGYKV
ncbi:alkaline phosphatase family protein [Halalkalicoccus salilacus]